MSLEKNPSTGKVLELFGPTIEFLTSPHDTQSDFCVLKGTLPPGISVPLHSHADTEDFFVISGEIEGLRHFFEETGRAETNAPQPCTFRRNQHKISILERLIRRECFCRDTNEFLSSQLTVRFVLDNHVLVCAPRIFNNHQPN